MTMYFVAGGDGCEGVPGRGVIKVRELGTLMMLGVRGPADPLNPLCDTVRVGRGCKKQIHHGLVNSLVTPKLYIIDFPQKNFVQVFSQLFSSLNNVFSIERTCVIVNVVLLTC